MKKRWLIKEKQKPQKHELEPNIDTKMRNKNIFVVRKWPPKRWTN